LKLESKLLAEGIGPDRQRMEWSVDLRYCRQVHEVTTPVQAAQPVDSAGLARLVDDFEALYERKFGKGSAYREAGIEMTAFRLTARGLMPRPELPVEEEGPADPGAALIGRRPTFDLTAGGMVDGHIYDFAHLRPGNEVVGPAVIHTPITTIVLHSGHRARVDRWRNTVVTTDG